MCLQRCLIAWFLNFWWRLFPDGLRKRLGRMLHGTGQRWFCRWRWRQLRITVSGGVTRNRPARVHALSLESWPLVGLMHLAQHIFFFLSRRWGDGWWICTAAEVNPQSFSTGSRRASPCSQHDMTDLPPATTGVPPICTLYYCITIFVPSSVGLLQV